MKSNREKFSGFSENFISNLCEDALIAKLYSVNINYLDRDGAADSLS